MMMIVALFPSKKKDLHFEIAKSVIDFFHERNVQVVVEDTDAAELSCPPVSSIPVHQIHSMISMGGDGTILKNARQMIEHGIPILGINLGHLGFMADVPLYDIYPSLEDFLEGAYTIENRLIIETSQPHSHFALNDFVIHRARNPSLVEISISVDGLFLNSFEADGVILSTPNGSTAYSLAAGGPILVPHLKAFVITPICPHTISNRPIVLSSESTVTVQYLGFHEPLEVMADGIDRFELKKEEKISFSLSQKTFRLINLNRRDYFSTLRTKLSWSGKLR